jgi:hypothetical protein
VDRIRGTLQASKVGQPRDGGQQPLLPLAEVKEVPGKKGTVMREAELKLARDRISREKSLIRETSQVCLAFYSFTVIFKLFKFFLNVIHGL